MRNFHYHIFVFKPKKPPYSHVFIPETSITIISHICILHPFSIRASMITNNTVFKINDFYNSSISVFFSNCNVTITAPNALMTNFSSPSPTELYPSILFLVNLALYSKNSCNSSISFFLLFFIAISKLG